MKNIFKIKALDEYLNSPFRSTEAYHNGVFKNSEIRNFSISWGSSLKMLHLRSMGMSFFVSCPITNA